MSHFLVLFVTACRPAQKEPPQKTRSQKKKLGEKFVHLYQQSDNYSIYIQIIVGSCHGQGEPSVPPLGYGKDINCLLSLLV